MADKVKKTAVHYIATATVENNGADYLEETLIIAHSRMQAVNAYASRIITVVRATPSDLLRAGREKIPVLDATGANGPVLVDTE